MANKPTRLYGPPIFRIGSRAAAKRAQDAIALETKPIMNQPDALVAKALEIAKGD